MTEQIKSGMTSKSKHGLKKKSQLCCLFESFVKAELFMFYPNSFIGRFRAFTLFGRLLTLSGKPTT